MMKKEALAATAKQKLDVWVNLDEVEIQALEALAGYGDKAFLEVFYKHLGEAYLKPYEAGLIALFEKIRTQLPPIIHRFEQSKQVWDGTHTAVPKDRT